MHLLRMRRHYRHKNAENGVAQRKLSCVYRKMAALNSNITLDFKREVVVWSKLRM